MLHVIYNTFLVLYAMLYFISEVLVISHIMQVGNFKWLPC
nr:unnamed protein product [Callosobruchus chinensis]